MSLIGLGKGVNDASDVLLENLHSICHLEYPVEGLYGRMNDIVSTFVIDNNMLLSDGPFIDEKAQKDCLIAHLPAIRSFLASLTYTDIIPVPLDEAIKEIYMAISDLESKIVVKKHQAISAGRIAGLYNQAC